MQLSEEDAYKLKIESKENPYILAKMVLGYNDLTPNFHFKYLCRRMMQPRKKIIRLWLIPRGFFKTTILTITHSIFLQINTPSIRIAIASAVLANAKSMVQAVGFHYLTNQDFRLLFPTYCPKNPQSPETTWTGTLIDLPNRGGRPVMEGTFEAFGADSTLTSRHFDHLILDDLVTRENSTTREQMQKVKDFYKACFPLRDNPSVPIDVVGTRWDDGDLYGDLEDQSKEEDSEIEVVKVPCRIDSQPTFPERYPIKELLKIKREMGSYLFSCCYDLDPVPTEEQVFKDTYFKYFKYDIRTKTIIRDDGEKIPLGNCYMAADGATEEGRGDFSSIVVGFKDSKENIYIIDVFWKQRDPSDFLDDLKVHYMKWNCIKYGIQKAVVEKMLSSFMKKKQREEKFYMNCEPLGINTRMNKEFAIKQMQPWYEAGAVWHNDKFRGTEFEDELLRFPKAKHDDIIDAEQMLFEIIRPSSKAVQSQEYDRNSLEMWKRRLKRALNTNRFSDATEAYINEATY